MLHNKEERVLDKMLFEMSKQIDDFEKQQARVRRKGIQFLVLRILDKRPAEEYEKLIALMDEQIDDMDLKKMAQLIIERDKEEAEKLGRKQGTEKAKREDIIKLLQIRFDNVPESIIKKINGIQSLARLNSLFEKAATIDTLDDFDE